MNKNSEPSERTDVQKYPDELTQKMKITLDKNDFSAWYNAIIELAGLSDKRYPIKGMNVWLPYGWKLMTNIDKLIRDEMTRTNHEEVCFPVLIPKTEFQKEADHIKGFDAQVYWVTQGGETELDIPLLLRPTSETAMYPMFALWIRSHADLPLKNYQIVNVFRYETKQTRSFIRVRELHFFEAHTCHTDFEDAERQIQEDLEIMKNISKKLCLAYLPNKRPDWDKFAGAVYSIGIDCLMPSGKCLQLASIHQYKENFSKAYNIVYESETGEHKHVHQTTYGMSERLIGAVIGVHGDTKGLILPPELAPYQVVIVPIFSKGENAKILEECHKLQDELLANGIRVHLDERDIRPGNKYYDWELKGMPIRLELGPKDIKAKQVTVVPRDTGKRVQLRVDNLSEQLKQILAEFAERLYEKSKNLLESSINSPKTLDDAKDKFGILKAGWCGDIGCIEQIEKYLDVSMLGTPIENVKFKGECLVCGKPTEIFGYFSKTY